MWIVVTGLFQTTKKATGKRRLGWALRTLRAIFNLVLTMMVVALVIVTAMHFIVVRDYSDRLQARYPDLAENSYVYDRNGDRIAGIQGAQNRETVGTRGLGKRLPEAVVAVEDRRFYQHFGVDVEGVLRAAWIDLRARNVEEGGSTITEQLMKNLFIPEKQRPETSFWRRFTQSSLAFSYEQNHTKSEILTSYLNTVYFGDGAYGAQVAAQQYFGKDAKDLTLSEAAALAGFLHAPSTYSPEDTRSNTRRALDRRDQVLTLMKHQGLISKREYLRAESAKLEFAPDPEPDDPDYQPFVEKVRREVQDNLGADALKKGGLRIQTTLNPGLQSAAVESAAQMLPYGTDPSAAVATVEPQSGAILALAGEENGFNLALDARRQPGSSFKPFVLAAALDQGISPESIYLSKTRSVEFDGQGAYTIGNYDSIERGVISLYTAMAESDNTVFVQLASGLGMKSVVEMAEALGIKEPLETNPATALGGIGTGVSPLDMASAYATFAGRGIYRAPYSVERIDRARYGESERVYDHRLRGQRVLSGNEAATVTDVLKGVVESGTASRFHDLGSELGHPSAGKTGTTDEFVDAWYVGYTPRLSTAVWVGYPDGNRSMTGVHGLAEVNGETLPLDLWSTYMQQATLNDPIIDFSAPDLSEFSYEDHSTSGS